MSSHKFKEFQENWKRFSFLIEQLAEIKDERINILMERYIQQNLQILNDVFGISIENLQRLQRAKNSDDVICTQARFTNEISHKLALANQRFINASLGHIADYNEWLKAHCDLATD